jgi:hypothetical protein
MNGASKHEIHYPENGTAWGETDPAGMEIDPGYARKHHKQSPFETFVHLCWEEVTWR